MTKKQLKKLANQMAELEVKIQNADNSADESRYKNEMMRLQTSYRMGMNDMIELDLLIQEQLRKKLV